MNYGNGYFCSYGHLEVLVNFLIEYLDKFSKNILWEHLKLNYTKNKIWPIGINNYKLNILLMHGKK